MDMERKATSAELKELNEKGEGVLRFIRFHQEDKDADITFPGFIQNQRAVLLASHNWKSDYPPLGSGESFEADGATHFRFRLNMHDDRAKAWHSWLAMDRKDGLQQVSYGFSPYQDATEKWQKDGRSGRYLKPRKDGTPGAKLHEVSFVVVGSGNDTGVLNIKAFDDLPEYDPMPFDDLKASGVRVASLIFPKDKWESADAARSWLSSHGYRTDIDTTSTSYRARQEDPSKFSQMRSFCINPSRDASPEECRVMAVGGPMKESRSVGDIPEHPLDVLLEEKQPTPDTPELVEDWQAYAEDRRPPLPVMIKWARLYRYHIPFLRDIRKKDGKEISPETIGEFSDLVHELVEVATLLNIKVMTSHLMPDVEADARRKERYTNRLQELSAEANAEEARKLQDLQESARALEARSRERERAMKFMSTATS